MGETFIPGSLGFLKSAFDTPMYSSDVNYPEYQEQFFYYLFGVTEQNCYGVIDFETEKVILFMPRPDNLYKIWMTVMSKDDMQSKYPKIDKIMYIDELKDYFKQAQPEIIYVNSGINTDTNRQSVIPEEDLYVDYC